MKALALLLLLPLAALAQEGPLPAPESPMGVLLQGLVGLAGAALTLLLGVAGAAIRAKSRDSQFGALVNQLWVLVQAAVAHAEAEIRPSLQQALADGSLSPEEAAALKLQVTQLVRDLAGTQLEQLGKAFALSDTAAATLLSGLVERAVAGLKAPPVAPPAGGAP